MAHAMTKRQMTIDELHRLGIHGPEIYLLDAMPLIEMAWADGEVHRDERSTILALVEKLLLRVQGEAGFAPVTTRQALDFVDRFTSLPPTPMQFSAWREQLKQLHQAEVGSWQERAKLILEGVLSVGEVSSSPQLNSVAWDAREVEAMWRIENSLLDKQSSRPSA